MRRQKFYCEFVIGTYVRYLNISLIRAFEAYALVFLLVL